MDKQDKRPDPKPRKRAMLWQSYLWWDELMQMRKRHTLRISSIEAGKSNLDAQVERDMMEHAQLDTLLAYAKKIMVKAGEATMGETWQWLTSIKGLGEGGLAAQLCAQIDDIALCDTVSALWRFAGYAVIDGERERNKPGEVSHYNRRLKSTCFLIVEQFIRQQTPLYAELYYDEKARQRRMYPEPVKVGNVTKYTDGHIHNRAMRKVAKIFLQHLWLKWREAEGLPVSMPYVHELMGHTHYVEAA